MRSCFFCAAAMAAAAIASADGLLLGLVVDYLGAGFLMADFVVVGFLVVGVLVVGFGLLAA